MPYVSITGMRVRSVWRLPRFAFHAVRSMSQARRAEGNLFADARKIDGVHHTLTVWTDRTAMLAYLRAGAHRCAMQAFPTLGMGYAFGFDAATRPDWTAVHALWLAEGVRRVDQRSEGAPVEERASALPPQGGRPFVTP
ncbi:hypothetical protein [Rhizobium sp. G21]|uniref:hypothetical protein n=1 Tax=Rhizobium sp. G21 TaxID=2758439 RepID=UPI001603FE98|nr:hypothetical protein [Rhizobium sp. G21]MBB1248138.1 hypothetical protein [Rhizobium sp. G21]